MATEDTRHRLLRYLNDAHAAERGGLVALEHIAGEATSPELKTVVADHARVTHTQADRLAARIEALGGKVEAAKSAVNTLIAAGSQVTNVFHDAADKRTQDVIKAYSLEHFEVGMYTALAAYAETIGDEETAWLARVIRSEEEQAGERLIALVPGLAASAVARTVEGKQAANAVQGVQRPAERGKSRLPFWGAATVGIGAGALLALRLLRRSDDDNEGKTNQVNQSVRPGDGAFTETVVLNASTDVLPVVPSDQVAVLSPHENVATLATGREEASDPLGGASHDLSGAEAQVVRAAARHVAGKNTSEERETMYDDAAESGQAGSMARPTGQENRNTVGEPE